MMNSPLIMIFLALSTTTTSVFALEHKGFFAKEVNPKMDRQLHLRGSLGIGGALGLGGGLGAGAEHFAQGAMEGGGSVAVLAPNRIYNGYSNGAFVSGTVGGATAAVHGVGALADGALRGSQHIVFGESARDWRMKDPHPVRESMNLVGDLVQDAGAGVLMPFTEAYEGAKWGASGALFGLGKGLVKAPMRICGGALAFLGGQVEAVCDVPEIGANVVLGDELRYDLNGKKRPEYAQGTNYSKLLV